MVPPVPAEAVMVDACAPVCVTVRTRPAILAVAVLDDPVLADTEYFTVPLPVPLLPEVIVIHDEPLAVQVQPLWVVTATFPVPPAEAKDWLVGDMVYVQSEDVVTDTSFE
jgi:hypothetical protein